MSKKSVLIGLAGLKAAGKDTVAFYLSRHFKFIRLALADPIRDGLEAMFRLTDDEMSSRDRKEAVIDWLGVSPRHLMQTLGTEWGRTHVAGDIWLRVAARRIAEIRSEMNNGPIVITDIRFENEAQWIREQGGVIWHVLRNKPASHADTHISEAGIARLPGDHFIDNASTLAALHTAVVTEAQAMGL